MSESANSTYFDEIKSWLTTRCTTTDKRELAIEDLISLGVNEEDRERLLASTDKRWIEKRWNPFISQLQTGDELWRFNSPEITWKNLMGRRGYAILRDGKVVAWLFTMMS